MTAPVLPLMCSKFVPSANRRNLPGSRICAFCFRINKIHDNVLTCPAFIHSRRPYTPLALAKAKSLESHNFGFLPL